MRAVPYRALVGRLARSEMQVGFTHCDPYGHMNTAAYLEAAINHRMTEVRQLIGLDVMQLKEQDGVIFIIRKVDLEFMEPALPGEWLHVESWLEELKAGSMKVIVRFSRREGGKTCAVITFLSAAFNEKKGLLVKIPESYRPVAGVDPEAMPWAPGHPKPG